MKKVYLKVLILIFFAMIVLSGNSYGIEFKPVKKETAEKPVEVETVNKAVETEKEEPEEKGTVILFTIKEVAEENDITEQAEDCSAISDAQNEVPANEEAEEKTETNENNKPIIREVEKNSYVSEIKYSEIKIGKAINKIVSKIYDESENMINRINVAKDKRESRKSNIKKVKNIVVEPVKTIGKVMKNNLLYIQKYADNQEYNRLSC